MAIKEFAAGLLKGVGRGMQDVAPVVAAKEAALKEEERYQAGIESAARIRQEDKYKFLYEQLEKKSGDWVKLLESDPMKASLDPQTRQTVLTTLAAIGDAQTVLGAFYLGSAGVTEQQAAEAADKALQGIASLNTIKKSDTPDALFKGDDYKTPPGGINKEQLKKDAVAAAKETAEKWFNSPLGSLAINQLMRIIEGVTEAVPEELKKDITDLLISIAGSKEAAYKGLTGRDQTPAEFRKEEEKRMGGLISQGSNTAPVSIFEGDVGQAEQMMMEGGQLGGSEITTTEPASETVTFEDPFSEEAINYRISQQPWNDPNVMEMGAVDIYPTNIPKESEDIEVKKAGLIRELAPLVKAAESNVNGYNAVAGSTKGDSELTNMTIKQIREKYGDKAVGVGQFKYGVFIRPIAEKYLGMTADQLDNVVFNKTFQDQLIALAAEDAGITKFLKGQISNAEFQKRFANIFRGMGASKTSKPGDTVDKYGNKVRTGGGLINEVLKEY